MLIYDYDFVKKFGVEYKLLVNTNISINKGLAIMKSPDVQSDDLVELESKSRRRLVRGAGGILPLGLMASAKSALACHCTSVSANNSIKLANSHNATTDVGAVASDCNGWSPSTWAGTTVTQSGNVFSTVFSSVPLNLASKTMKQMAARGNSDIYAIFAAAYLNSMTGRVGQRFYKVSDLKAMWPVAMSGTGVYEPVPGAKWTAADIRLFLTQTW